MEIMDYPFPSLEYTAKARRNIGVGITDLAGLMAEKRLKYSSVEGKKFLHTLAEQHSYGMISASLRLAKERGECAWVSKTKWKEGWLPIDTMNTNIGKKVGQPLLLDWEGLRTQIKEHGVRFSVTTNFMPNESSSVATNGTNSILPARNTKLVKTNGKKKTRFLVPNYDTLKDEYELAWDMETIDLFDVYAIFQRFCDQSISADEYLDFVKEDVKGTSLLKSWMYMQQVGMKTRYYVNSRTRSGNDAKKDSPEEVVDTGCAGGGCSL